MKNCFGILIAVIASLCLGTAALAGDDLMLVQDGKPVSVIVIPDAADPAAKSAATAAKVFVDHIAQMSGAKLAVHTAADLGTATVQNGVVTAATGKLSPEIKSIVFIGESALAKQAGFSNEGLSAGGILMKTSGNALAIIGSTDPIDPQATTYAVVDCLENLGCRYLWPGESGKVIPKRSTVTIAAVDHTFSPPIQQRNIRIIGMSERPETGLKKLGLDRPTFDAAFSKASQTESPISWLAWNRQGGNIGIVAGAAGSGLRGGWQEFGKTHPEWFSQQVDGSRDQSAAAERWQLCVSNESLIEHVADDIIQRVNENPKLVCVSLCPNDGGSSAFCQCDECKKLDPPDAPKVKMIVFPKTGSPDHKEIEVPALTDRYVHYWNAIAERVEKVHPKLLFVVEAYSYYSTPPVREKLNPNLIVRYVPSTTDGWDGWQKAGTKRIYWRPNILLAGRKDGMDHSMVGQLATRMAYMADNGVLATDFDSILNSWSVNGLNYYAAARLNWNPHLTVDQILDDYCQGGFGLAGSSIKQYFQLVQKITEDENRVFTPEKIGQLRASLDAADKAAGSDQELLARIAFLRLGLNYTDLSASLSRLADAANGKTGPELTAIKTKARPLLDLNFLVLRDVVKNHNLAINASYLVWAGNEFATWAAIDGRGYRPADAILALGDAPGHTLTGHENSIDAMMAAFALKPGMSIAQKPGGSPDSDQNKAMDADENGKPIQVIGK